MYGNQHNEAAYPESRLDVRAAVPSERRRYSCSRAIGIAVYDARRACDVSVPSDGS